MSEVDRSESQDNWPAILTWRAHDVPRMESVRVSLSGNRVKAYGRIVAAATPSHPAFSASYDLVTDDVEGMWMVQDQQNQSKRETHDGALDVDVILSPFFNALPIRRTGLYEHSGEIALPVVYVRLPELTVETVVITYASEDPDPKAGIKLKSPVA